METVASIHEFWFGTEPDDARVAEEKAGLWWMKNPAVDRLIRERFEQSLDQAARGELDGWLAFPLGRLALILLADQFARNMFRDTKKAFEYDALARTWCRDGLEKGIDRLLRPIERVFFYLPLEHSESLEDQERAVLLFEQLAEMVGEREKPVFTDFLDYARRHREIIQRFGRFPHRNRILGRSSTQEEEKFLSQPGSSF